MPKSKRSPLSSILAAFMSLSLGAAEEALDVARDLIRHRRMAQTPKAAKPKGKPGPKPKTATGSVDAATASAVKPKKSHKAKKSHKKQVAPAPEGLSPEVAAIVGATS